MPLPRSQDRGLIEAASQTARYSSHEYVPFRGRKTAASLKLEILVSPGNRLKPSDPSAVARPRPH